MSSTATASALPFGAKPQEKKKNSTAEVVAASMVGTAIEFYDNYCYSIAAASIIAKVTRDRMMREYDKLFPKYDFAKNKGYGTAEHVVALK